jgi:hypothetical protein
MDNKIVILIPVLIILLNIPLSAHHDEKVNNKEVVGIFLTIDDFKNGKLIRPTDKIHKGDKIKLKQFFYSPDIISVEQDSETVFFKDSIFAILAGNGTCYRFINHTPCLVADTSNLYIYTHKTIKTIYKLSGPHRRATEIPVTNYFFSSGNHNTVYILTLENLHKYVLSDSEIHAKVCNKFKTDAMLQKVNPETGRFEINETILSMKK